MSAYTTKPRDSDVGNRKRRRKRTQYRNKILRKEGELKDILVRKTFLILTQGEQGKHRWEYESLTRKETFAKEKLTRYEHILKSLCTPNP